MNRIRLVFSILVASFIGFMAVSCEQPEPDGPGTPDTPENPEKPGEVTPLTISCILGAEEGSTATFEIEAAAEWQIGIGVSAFTVSPTEGEAGKHTITVTAAETNEGMGENVYKFNVMEGGEPQVHSYFVIHRGTPGIEISDEAHTIGATDLYVNIPYKGAFEADELDMDSDAEWIGFHGMDVTVEPALLEDGITYSNYSEGIIRFLVSESNDGEEAREATLSISLGEQKYEISVTQNAFALSEPDFTREFFKTSLIHKIGGAFCTNCPYMTYHLDSLSKVLPGRTVVASLHAGSKVGLDWMDGRRNLIDKLWNEGEMPTAIFNNYGNLFGYSTFDLTDLFCQLVDQTNEIFPATTGIAGSASMDGDKVSIEIRVAAGNNATKPGYRLTVFIMEDGLYEFQNGGEYVPLEDPNTHNHVVRGSLSSDYDLGGESIALTPGKVLTQKFELDLKALPSNFSKIEDSSKLKVLAYVTYDDSYTPEKNSEGAVRAVEYYDYGFVVDNSAVFAVGSGVDYRYE